MNITQIPSDILRLIILEVPPTSPVETAIFGGERFSQNYHLSTLGSSAKGFLSLSRSCQLFRRLCSEERSQKIIRERLLLVIKLGDNLLSILPNGNQEGWQTCYEISIRSTIKLKKYFRNGIQTCTDDVRAEYNDGMNVFSEFTYDDTGFLLKRDLWIDGKQRSLAESFCNDGTLFRQKFHDIGVVYQWHSNGERESMRKVGKRILYSHHQWTIDQLGFFMIQVNGKCIQTFLNANGTLSSHTEMSSDYTYYDGLEATYHDNGSLKSFGFWKQGRKIGFHEEYYDNGNLQNICYYRNGAPDGIQKIFNENGFCSGKIWWRNGLKIKEKTWYVDE